MGRTRTRKLVIIGVSALMALCASPAAAGVTIGQIGTPADSCSGDGDNVQLTVTDGSSYFVPAIPPATALTLTSWIHRADINPGQRVEFKVYRPVAGMTNTFTIVALETHDLASGTINTFPTSIPVQPGDTIGINGAPGNGSFGCGFGNGGETYYSSGSSYHPLGSQLTFNPFSPGYRLNLSATVEPTNTLGLGRPKRNVKNGTATLALQVPNPGELTVSGNGLKAASTGATEAKSVSAGAVNLKIKAKGKKLATLNRTGKVKLSPSITYTPTGGSPKTQSTKVKLKKTG